MHALCLSAGGMFGAYQAGAWLELSRVWKPQIVVGASVGALNGYAIASRFPPEELVERWLHLSPLARHRIQVPFPPKRGLVEATAFESIAREVHAGMKPVLPLGVVATRLPSFRPQLFRDGDIQWQHLAASCAVLGVLPGYKLNGSCYADGGLLGALPIWAAVEMGATHIVAINVLPRMPWWIRLPLLTLKRIRVQGRKKPTDLVVIMLAPDPGLGGWKEAVWWSRSRAEQYIERGRQDAKAVWQSIS